MVPNFCAELESTIVNRHENLFALIEILESVKQKMFVIKCDQQEPLLFNQCPKMRKS